MTLSLDRPALSPLSYRRPFGQDWAELLAPLLGYGRAAGADLVEVFLERSQYLSGMAEEDQITSVSPRLGSGAGIRVFLGTQDSYVSTNDLSPRGLQAALERALEILGLSLPDPRTRLIPDFNLGMVRDYGATKQHWLERCSSMQEMGEILLQANQALARHGSHMQSRRSVYFRDWQDVLVAASDGTFAHDIRLTQSVASTLLCADGSHRASVGRFYDEEKDKLATQKSRLLAALQEINHITPAETIPERLLWQGIPKLSGIVSRVTMGNQFPMMPYAQFVAQTGRFPQVQRDHWQRVEQRAMDLVLGGIFDHVGGGFHRYTVDPTWTVPHFEKMLYDNGQILEFLSDVWAMGFRDAAIQRAVTQTVAWLKREMTHPEGYFYAAQDADSFAAPGDPEPEEGEFYVWRWSELESLLSQSQFRGCQKAFDLSPGGNFRERPGCIVLQRLTGGSLGPEVEAALEQLFSRRYGSASLETFLPALDTAMAKTHPWPGRIPPVTDTKLIVAWNSLMIAGLARAYQVFRDPQMLALAEGAARFLTTQQWNGEALYRLNYDGVVAVPAKAEDYAFLIRALLHLHQTQVTQDPEAANHWLNLAITIQAHFDQTLWDPEAGGYFMADPAQSQDLVIREKETQDNATPSANGIALQNLVRLAALTGDLKYLDRAETGLRTFATLMQNQPRSCPSLYGALDLYQHFCRVSALPQEQQALQQQYHPTTLFTADPLPPESVGMVCEGLKCLPPVSEAWILRQYLEKAETRGS